MRRWDSDIQHIMMEEIINRQRKATQIDYSENMDMETANDIFRGFLRIASFYPIRSHSRSDLHSYGVFEWKDMA